MNFSRTPTNAACSLLTYTVTSFSHPPKTSKSVSKTSVSYDNHEEFLLADTPIFKQLGEPRIDREVFQDLPSQISKSRLRPGLKVKVNEPFRDPPFRIAKELRIDPSLFIVIDRTQDKGRVEQFTTNQVGTQSRGIV